MDINKGHSGGILCPDLKMFKKDVLPTIREICAENNISYEFNKSDSIFFFPQTNTTVYVFHGTDHESIRGPNLAFMLINEVTLIGKDSFDSAVGRVRIKDAKLLQVAMSGTPEGVSNWAYEYFIENPRDDTDLIFGNTRENYHVADSYVRSLEDSYDSKLIQAYVDGKFINMTGNLAAYAFDRFKHLDDKIVYKTHLKTYVSIDFNINPMSAVLWNRTDIKSLHYLEAFDEISLQGSNTYDLAKVIKEKVGTEITLYPDPAGKAGSTKSHFSDFDILRQAGFKDIKFKSQVSVRDSLNSMNNLFDKNQIKIHPKCKNLIADLEQCTIKDGGYEIDKTNAKRTHWLDGLKNMCEYEFPIIKPTVVRVSKYA
jgi:PBSX family phage terminase large subunit